MRSFILLLLGLLSITDSQAQVQERLSFNQGWRFYMGDIPMPVITGHSMSYSNAKAGRAWGAAAPDFDDTDWRLVDLPHDWAIEQPFDSTANVDQNYRPRGMGWYRRSFKMDPQDRGKYIELQFGAIATHATVWLNGTIVHRNWCGYTSFYIDATPFLKYGDELNTIAIRVDATAQEGWWYEGAGLYRHVWMLKKPALHLTTDGVYANPVKEKDRQWQIPVQANLMNIGKEALSADVEVSLLNPHGKLVTRGVSSVRIPSLSTATASLLLKVDDPTLWTLEDPALYTVKTEVKQQGRLIDQVSTRCGFRTIRFDADSGFFLNEKNIKIKGVCNHQDHAGVGVAVPNSLWEFRIRKLKEIGVNAYRCAHNPPAAEFLDACDSLGLLVMDENRIFNSSPEYQRQLEWLIRRDRNHPSVIMWSIFNEEPQGGTEVGYEMIRRMNAVVKSLDTTRSVTAAMNGGQFSPINVAQAVDVVGFNYHINDYDKFHKLYPHIPVTSSEDVSCYMQRGVYVTDKNKRLLASYDNDRSGWGSTHRYGWKAIAERPFMAGCFIWTGFDYRGEPTPYTWPTAASNFGIMDQCGFPKTAYYLHQAQWLERPILHLVPHWNWPADSIGRNIRVMSLTNAEKVRILVNGKIVGEQKVDKYEMNYFNVPYQPGTLEAIGYKGGKEISRFSTSTTGAPVQLQLIADRKALAGDGADAVPVTVQVLDAKGRPVPTANIPVDFEVEGEGILLGLGNGDPNNHELEKSSRRHLYNGLAQAIIQSKLNGNGKLILKARAEGLKPATLRIEVQKTAVTPFVPVIEPLMVLSDKWRMSAVSSIRPEPNQNIEDTDMNSWVPVKTGSLQNFDDGNFLVYRTTFKPYKAQQVSGGKILFRKITGKAEVWIDGRLAGRKDKFQEGDLTVELPPATSTRTLNVLIESEEGQKAGLGGAVQISLR